MSLVLDDDDIAGVIEPLASYLHTAFGEGVSGTTSPNVVVPGLPGYATMPPEHQISSRDVFRLVAAAMVATGMGGGGGGGGTHASLIVVTPTGNLTATNVQSALEELQAEIDGISTGAITAVTSTGSGAVINHPLTSTTLRLKTLVQGQDIQISEQPEEGTLTIANIRPQVVLANIGSGAKVFESRSGYTYNLRSIVAGTNVTLQETSNGIVVNANPPSVIGEANTGSNVGAGVGIYAGKQDVDLRFKSLVAGSNITITPNTNTVTISSVGGEIITASNIGSGAGIFSAKVGTDLRFKSLIAGTGTQLNQTSNAIEILNTGVVTVANTGSGAGIFASKSGTQVNLKSIVAGSNISIAETGENITISASGGGSGGNTEAANVGGGEGLYRDKTGDTLNFKSLLAGPGVDVTSDANTVTVSSDPVVSLTPAGASWRVTILPAGEFNFSA